MSLWVGKFVGVSSGEIDWARLDCVHDIDRGWKLIPTGKAFGLAQWHQFKLITFSPLVESINIAASKPLEFTYPIIIVRGIRNFIVLAQQKDIAEFVNKNVLPHVIARNHTLININVDSFVDDCLEPDANYVVTNLHGQYAGNFKEIKSMSLYGTDLCNWRQFPELRGLFNFVTLGAALNDPQAPLSRSWEVGRVGNDGSVQSFLKNRQHARDFLTMIQFTVKNRWVPEWAQDGLF